MPSPPRSPGAPNPPCTTASTSTCPSGRGEPRRGDLRPRRVPRRPAPGSCPAPPARRRSGTLDGGGLVTWSGASAWSRYARPSPARWFRWLATGGERVQEASPGVAARRERRVVSGEAPTHNPPRGARTGASRGIGLACVEWFSPTATGGGHLPRREGAGGSWRPEWAGRFLPVRCDVTTPATSSVLQRGRSRLRTGRGPCLERRDHRDTLVLRMGDDAWDDVLATTSPEVFGGQAGHRQDAPPPPRPHHLRLLGGGVRGLPGQANYAASKAGLWHGSSHGP